MSTAHKGLDIARIAEWLGELYLMNLARHANMDPIGFN
jgi:hypothetical protein